MNQDLITDILLAVFLLCAIGVIVIGGWMYRRGPSSKRQGRISHFVDPSVDDSQVTLARDSTLLSTQNIGKFRDWINDSLHGFSSDKLQLQLSSAYWTITDTEYILIRIVATMIAFFMGWLIPGNILGGILLAAITIIVPPILLDRAIDQRQQKFHNQLLDVLLLITGAVQAGYSLMQALDLAVKEVPAPASEEFGRVLHEIRFGISLEGTLFNLAERMASDDMQIVVTAIIINSQVGGNLSTVLESTISTIRDRMHLVGEIRSLTSYARYVGNFLSLMPFIMGFIIFLMAPDFFDTVKTSMLTRAILLMALLGLIIGNIWIRRIIKIRV
ncbi:MAG: type II secretion system F family protein [Anaerolineaceae bacterium]|nr:type II secretion system F family protein [Anaerolineaceae bacterium]